MADIVLGLGTSHTPQLSSGADRWEGHAERDRRSQGLRDQAGDPVTYDELLARADPAIADELAPAVWRAKFDRGQAAVAKLAARLAEAAPDVVVVVGDDQRELFGPTGNPAIAFFVGEELWDLGMGDESQRRVPPDILAARWAAHADNPEAYPVAAGLSGFLAEQLTGAGFDLSVFSEQPAGRTLGHAFTFVRLRLGLPAGIPIVPVLLNTFYPPNVPSPARCYALGTALRQALEAWPRPDRVAVVASGGLSHTVINETLDRQLLDALAAHDPAAVAALPRRQFQAGTSECLNWLVAGGAMDGARLDVLDYIPGYRTPAGTGTAMTFATWTPA